MNNHKTKLEESIAASIRYLESESATAAVKTDPYWPKWDAPWWHVTLLWEMGHLSRVPEKILDLLFHQIDAHYIHFFPVRPNDLPPDTNPHTQVPCHCQLGTIYQILFEAGYPIDERYPWIREWFLKYQLSDGGLNCSEDVYTKEAGPSSIVSSLPVFEAMLLKPTDVPYEKEELAFLTRAYHYLIKRGLFRSVRKSGSPMNPDFLKLIFPRFYEYDILRGLRFIQKYCIAFDVPFPKDAVSDAVDAIKTHENERGELVITRRFLEKKTSGMLNPSGDWKWGMPSSSYSLLELTSAPGEVSPYLTQEWRLFSK